MEIGFIHAGGDSYRPVIVFKRDANGKPIDFTYFATGKQINIMRNVSRLKKNENAKEQELAEDDLAI